MRPGISRWMNSSLLVSLLMLVAACQAAAPAVDGNPPAAGGTCDKLSSSDWRAWINAMPGPGASPTLIVTGKVRTPTGGWRLGLRLDPAAMESDPPQRTVWLDAVPPSGAATQALVDHQLRGSWPVTPPLGAVHIRCGDRMIGHVSPVETAH